ncbi:hypothetical protein [Acrocarpospora pleiomorpha]|uniref:hypothetical protein n=1 Tax=Acrocarpospora pleiomorpha TaxID=90975 RepID=UPI0012D2D461|nr:hypothetical protein [Acrocarpospora pleiomorpha]
MSTCLLSKRPAAVDVLMTTPPATETGEVVSVVDAWSAIEQVVPRDQLAEALATIAAVAPGHRRGRRRGMAGRAGRPLRHGARLHPPVG